MRQPPAPRLLLLAGLGAATALASGCAVGPSAPDASSGASGASGLPTADAEGYAPLAMYLVAADGEGPTGAETRAFGCGDLLVRVETVPSREPDPLLAALDFLTEDMSGEHGRPALTNAVVGAAPDLVLTGHRREGDTEVVTFSGPVSPEDDCAAQRLRAQLQETARAQTSAATVRLEVDGTDLDTLLGLAPLALSPAEAGSAATATSPAASATPERARETSPAAEPSTEPTPESTTAPSAAETSPAQTTAPTTGRPSPEPSRSPTPSTASTPPPTLGQRAGEPAADASADPAPSGSVSGSGEPSATPSASPSTSSAEEGDAAPAQRSTTPAETSPAGG
ncbi:hypothetical protein AB0302_08220 [Micrococcus sp. NPDC078436]|uniref:hypothetical protein n=1 Tax=Micrococcus sp. NPDC078436 TaxID=3154960 RepID=UPI0034506869